MNEFRIIEAKPFIFSVLYNVLSNEKGKSKIPTRRADISIIYRLFLGTGSFRFK